ncbi:FISUMP domain-containing protein, partial [Fibrobacter sp. UBA4297]
AAMDSVGIWNDNGKGCGFGESCSPKYPVHGVCPEGWHLPTDEEWNTLFTAVGGLSTASTNLKSTSGWYEDGNGTDAFGFSALPAGMGEINGDYSLESGLAYFWSSTEKNSSSAYCTSLRYSKVRYSDTDAILDYGGKGGLLSVRCLKD